MNIHVANLPREFDEKRVRELFAAYGTVGSVTLDMDKITGKPTGFCQVEMPEEEQAKAAIAALHGKKLTEYPLSLKDVTEPPGDHHHGEGPAGRGRKGNGGGRGGARGSGFRGSGFQGGVARRGGQRGS